MSEVITSPLAYQATWTQFADREYRQGYAEGHVGDFLATQLRSMRFTRGLSQVDLAKLAHTNQPQISAWEGSCEGINLSSLHRLADVFDVALIVKFAPFSALAREALMVPADRNVPSYVDDSAEAISFGAIQNAKIEPWQPRYEARNGSTKSSYLRGPGASVSNAAPNSPMALMS